MCRWLQNVEASRGAIYILMRHYRAFLHSHSDLAGIDGVLQDIRELIEYPLTHPEIYTHIGIDPPRGILLHGPPGCGKTLLARAVGGELGVPLISISAPEIVSGMSGESEEKVSQIPPCDALAAQAVRRRDRHRPLDHLHRRNRRDYGQARQQ